MSKKTNAIRLLEQLNIPYKLREYDVDENDLSAEHVAETLGISPEKIYKTLVLKGQNHSILVAVIPGNAQLDLKKTAKVSNNKNCDMLPPKDLLANTGYIRGGCSPLGMKKKFPTYIEEMALLEEEITISAGKKGWQIIIKPKDLASAIDAYFVDICS